jgi:hypothetical protein
MCYTKDMKTEKKPVPAAEAKGRGSPPARAELPRSALARLYRWSMFGEPILKKCKK